MAPAHRPISAPGLVACLLGVLAACTASEPSPPVVPRSPLPSAATPSAAPSESPSPTASATPSASPEPEAEHELRMESFAVPAGSRPHDVAPATDGGVWYVAQQTGRLGWLDPQNGEVREIPLGAESQPHGVIVGPDGSPWITDGGLNAIVTVDPETEAVTVHRLPADAPPNANLNTATFDDEGILWFTGQAGIYGSLDPETGEIAIYDAPDGGGPYGISTTPDGDVYFSALAGSYLGAIDTETGAVDVIETPTPGGGARRVWPDSDGRLWVTEWDAGLLAMYDPSDESWREWPLPGDSPMPFAVYVDETDAVWVTDFGANAMVRFDPQTETFMSLAHESTPAQVRQLLGREGEVWGAESAADRLVVVRFGP